MRGRGRRWEQQLASAIARGDGVRPGWKRVLDRGLSAGESLSRADLGPVAVERHSTAHRSRAAGSRDNRGDSHSSGWINTGGRKRESSCAVGLLQLQGSGERKVRFKTLVADNVQIARKRSGAGLRRRCSYSYCAVRSVVAICGARRSTERKVAGVGRQGEGVCSRRIVYAEVNLDGLHGLSKLNGAEIGIGNDLWTRLAARSATKSVPFASE